MHDWQVDKKHTCVQPESCRAMPEKEKPPAMRVDLYYSVITAKCSNDGITKQLPCTHARRRSFYQKLFYNTYSYL